MTTRRIIVDKWLELQSCREKANYLPRRYYWTVALFWVLVLLIERYFQLSPPPFSLMEIGWTKKNKTEAIRSHSRSTLDTRQEGPWHLKTRTLSLPLNKRDGEQLEIFSRFHFFVALRFFHSLSGFGLLERGVTRTPLTIPSLDFLKSDYDDSTWLLPGKAKVKREVIISARKGQIGPSFAVKFFFRDYRVHPSGHWN